MALNKEQILLVATVVVCGGLLALAGGEVPSKRVREGKGRKVESATLPPPVLTYADPAGKATRGDLFLQPSESEPLPPLDLAPPPRNPLPIVAPLPLPGPGPAGFAVLRVSGVTEAQPAKLTGGGAAPAAPGAGVGAAGGEESAAAGGETALLEDEDLKRRYDWIQTSTGTFYGYIQDPTPTRGSRFDLKPPLDRDLVLKIQTIRKKTGTRGMLVELTADKIVRFGFAQSTANWVELKKRTLPRGEAYMKPRILFIQELLERCEESPAALAEVHRQTAMLLADCPSSPQAYKVKGQVLYRTGQLDKEYLFYKGLLAKAAFDKLAFVHLGLARVYDRLTLKREARAEYEKARKLEPSSWEVQSLFGAFRLAEGRYREAIEPLERAWRFIPSELTAIRFENRFRLISAHLGLGDVEAARKVIAGVRESNTTEPRLDLVEGITAICAGKLDEALEHLGKANEGLSSRAEPGLALGVAYALQGKYNEALDALASSEDMDPLVRPRVKAAKAWVLRRAGHPSKAITEAEAGLAMAPDDPYLLYLTGRLRRENGDLAGARALFDTMLRHNHLVPEVLIEMAAVESEDEALSQAEYFASRTLELAGDRADPAWTDFLGDLYLRQRKTHDAEELFSEEIRRSRSLHARLGVAQAIYYQGDTAACLDLLKDIAESPELGSGNTWVAYANKLYEKIRLHTLKNQVLDDFKGSQLARGWRKEAHRNAEPKVDDGKLLLQGKLVTKNKSFMVTREGENPKQFVSVAVDCTILPGHTAEKTGLRIGVRRRSRARAVDDPEITIFWHTFSGKPCTQVTGNRIRDEKMRRLTPIEDPSLWKKGEPTRLLIEYGLMPGGDERSPKKVLRLYVGGTLVRRLELTTLGAGAANLHIDLFADGKSGEKVNARFSRFRLVRTEEIRRPR